MCESCRPGNLSQLLKNYFCTDLLHKKPKLIFWGVFFFENWNICHHFCFSGSLWHSWVGANKNQGESCPAASNGDVLWDSARKRCFSRAAHVPLRPAALRQDYARAATGWGDGNALQSMHLWQVAKLLLSPSASAGPQVFQPFSLGCWTSGFQGSVSDIQVKLCLVVSKAAFSGLYILQRKKKIEARGREFLAALISSQRQWVQGEWGREVCVLCIFLGENPHSGNFSCFFKGITCKYSATEQFWEWDICSESKAPLDEIPV